MRTAFPAGPVLAALSAVLALGFAAAPARAALGDCGQPASSGDAPVASDALGVLRAAVGTLVCEACVCDVNADGNVASSDALHVLRFAVGASAGLDCLVCPKETTLGNIGGSAVSLDGRVRVTVPPGALSKDTKITVEEAPATLLAAALRSGGVEVWRVKPKDLALGLTGKISLARSETLLPGNGVVGAPLALVAALDGGDVSFLDGQNLAVDGRTGVVRAGAELDVLGVFAFIPVDVTVRLSGIPTGAAGAGTVAVKARVEQGGAEDRVDVHNPAYTDDDFGAWTPVGGEINNRAIQKQGDGLFEESIDYSCTSTALTNFTPSIRTLVDVTADVPGAPEDLLHRTFPVAEIDCDP